MKKHIIYLTTAMEQNDFKEYLNHWQQAPNTSNQNFHNKMIRSLADNYKVDVISVRPFVPSLCDLKQLNKEVKIDDNITWHYLSIYKNKIKKVLSLTKEVKKLIKNLYTNESVIFVDTINTSIIYLISKIKNRHKHDIIGIVTDSPTNISNTKKSYATYLLDRTRDFSGYISLTKELDGLFNRYSKPSVIIEGIVEKPANSSKMSIKEPFFFFGGAMMERYGVYELIKAFNSLNESYPDVYLYMCGHHVDNKKIHEIVEQNNHIRYLGTLGYEDVLKFEQCAIANINPRPFSSDLDRFSIPSKTLEYMVSGRPTISVKNSILEEIFKYEIVWAKSSYYKDLKDAMEKVLTSTKQVNDDIGSKAKKKVLQLYSFKSVSKKIKELIDELD